MIIRNNSTVTQTNSLYTTICTCVPVEVDYGPQPKINLKATKILENAIKARTSLKDLIYKPYSGTLIIKRIRVILKALFPKSGKLNKRIRRIRKDK